MVFFSGWLGYAVANGPGSFVEPSDTAYQRRPILFSNMSGAYTVAETSGTIGPASVNWGQLLYVGLFAAQTGGYPVLWMSLAQPVTVQAGSTFSEGSGAYTLQLIASIKGGSSNVLPIGAMVAITQYGASCFIGANAQVVEGQLGELAVVMNPLTSAGALPGAPGISGSLWMNGGVISVS